MLKSWLIKQKGKQELRRVFDSAGLFIPFSYGSSQGKLYPKVHSVRNEPENGRTVYTFSLPVGLDPKEFRKKEYVFKQVMGRNLVLKGDHKTFTLTVYVEGLPDKALYDFESYKQNSKPLHLPILAGIDKNGEMIIYDMLSAPHLLIAGETGSGKSTQLRSILTTLIKTMPANQLELYLCDLKRSEFHLFRDIWHVRGLYVSAGEMLPMLEYLQQEMIVRGNLLDESEVAHINDLKEPPSYIVVCIDEVALLQKERRIMELIEEISAIGRALGIFLILSMQRPDSKVLDGKLKNNLTVRMGFRCADLINSRIIGTPGSEKITENGRMILKHPSFVDNIEIQAPFLGLEEAKKLLEGYKYPKDKTRLKPPLNANNEVLQKEDIFGVLDE